MPKIIQFCRRALVLYENITIEFGYCIVDYVQSIHVLTVFFVRLYAFIYFFCLTNTVINTEFTIFDC